MEKNAQDYITNHLNRKKLKNRVTLLIPHMYEQTAIELAMAEGQSVDEAKAKEAIRHFEDFYEEVF